MKKLLLIPLIISTLASAELYKDYAPASEPVELTVIAVQSNYLDTYLTNLNRTWVRAMNVQKQLGYITDFNVWTAMSSADTPNVWLTVEAEPEVLFEQPYEQRLDAAAKLLGIDLSLVAPEAGYS